ncbi:MAG: hypothetical protein BRC26_01285, partial [Nanohaloarchaea archaeon QH_8_44_6]
SLSGKITPTGSRGFSSSDITPASVRKLNKKAKNQGADAIIYDINSGGGAVVASKEIKREIESVEVPTVCRFRDIVASGGYLIALGCDRIVSDSASLTGSIGVKSSYLEFSGLMNKLGVEYVNISTGNYKEVGSPYRNISDSEKQLLLEKAERVDQEFTSMIQTERNLSESQMEEIETAQPFLGYRAEELGLVDQLGGRKVAVKAAENITGKNLKTFKVKQKTSIDLLSILTADSALGNFLSTDYPLKATY